MINTKYQRVVLLLVGKKRKKSNKRCTDAFNCNPALFLEGREMKQIQQQL